MLSDGAGLHLFILPSGTKLWRFRCHYNGKANMLSFGGVLLIGLAEAWTKRDDARKLLSQGMRRGK